MKGNTTQEGTKPTSAVAQTADALIDEMYRNLVQIHNAIAIRTNDDREIIPWTECELMDLIQKLGAFRREQRKLAAKSESEAARA